MISYARRHATWVFAMCAGRDEYLLARVHDVVRCPHRRPIARSRHETQHTTTSIWKTPCPTPLTSNKSNASDKCSFDA